MSDTIVNVNVAAAINAGHTTAEANELLGPLHGVPLLIKDNIDTRDLSTSAGTPTLEHDTPARNASSASSMPGR